MSDERACTCHPDDNPPQPCPKQYALTECEVNMAHQAEIARHMKERDALADDLAQEQAWRTEAKAEVERLKHDIGRYLEINSDLATEVERLKALLRSLRLVVFEDNARAALSEQLKTLGEAQ